MPQVELLGMTARASVRPDIIFSIDIAVRVRFAYCGIHQGRMLLFFPGTKASMPDTRTLHTAGEAAVGHEKWISQLWVCAYAGKHAPEGKPPGPGDRAARRAAEKAAKKAAKKSGGGGRK